MKLNPKLKLLLPLLALMLAGAGLYQTVVWKMDCPTFNLGIITTEDGLQVTCYAGVEVTPTPPASVTPAPVGTATPRGTATKAATNTPVPTLPGATNTPVATVPGTGLIDDSVLPCAEHPSGWHALVSFDASGKPLCHYNHEHKHDPMSDCGAKFGEPGAWYGSPGESVSYPWQTILENEHKHEPYGWVVRCDIPPDELSDKPNFIKNFRAEIHTDPICILMPLNIWAGCHIGSQHSFQIEAEVCKKSDPNDCGIFQFGGWGNTGDLNIRNEKGEDITFCAPLPDVSPLCPHGDGGSRIYFDAAGPPFNPAARAHSFFWYMEMSASDVETLEIINPTVFAVALGDSFHEVSLDNLLFEDPTKSLFCPAFDCQFNGSTISMHEISFFVPPKLDPNGDGYVDGIFWVDQHGRINDICMVISRVINPGDLACIPWKFTHVPIGSVKYGDPENLGIGVMGSQDFDLSPAFTGLGEQWWVDWPKRFYETLEHTP